MDAQSQGLEGGCSSTPNSTKPMKTKLVRDKMPDYIHAKGETAEFCIAVDDADHQRRLYDKLQEELHEFIADETIEELADIMEVIEAICLFKHIPLEVLSSVQEQKRMARGGFTKRVVLTLK